MALNIKSGIYDLKKKDYRRFNHFPPLAEIQIHHLAHKTWPVDFIVIQTEPFQKLILLDPLIDTNMANPTEFIIIIIIQQSV